MSPFDLAVDLRLSNAAAAILEYMDDGTVAVADNQAALKIYGYEDAQAAKLRKLERCIGIVYLKGMERGTPYHAALKVWFAVYQSLLTMNEDQVRERAKSMSVVQALRILEGVPDKYQDAVLSLESHLLPNDDTDTVDDLFVEELPNAPPAHL